MPCPRVAGHVAERIGRNIEDRFAGRAVEKGFGLWVDPQIDLEQGVRRDLPGQGGERFPQRPVGAADRTQPQNVAAQVGDGHVQPVDRVTERHSRLGGLAVDLVGSTLDDETESIQRLDRPIVQVHANAVSLLERRHLAGLCVQARVLDRDRRLRGQGEEGFFVLDREFRRAPLLGEIQIAHALPPPADRNAEEARHRRMVRGKAD